MAKFVSLLLLVTPSLPLAAAGPNVRLALDYEPVIDEKLVDTINSLSLGWTARAHSIFINRTVSDVRHLTGLLMPETTSHAVRFTEKQRVSMFQRTQQQHTKLSQMGWNFIRGLPSFNPWFPPLYPPFPNYPTLPPIIGPTLEPIIIGPDDPIPDVPTEEPPTDVPTHEPTDEPAEEPTDKPTDTPTDAPTDAPTKKPTSKPTKKPTNAPTKKPTSKPTQKPTTKPKPTIKPTPGPVDPNGIPESFDAREQWGDVCASLHDIRDQSTCGSCWAFSTAEVATDRTCIASQGALQPYIGAQDLLTCCPSCGSCSGGYLKPAFDYWVSSGIVTGGAKGNTNTCRPYSFPCTGADCSRGGTPQCQRTCQTSYTIPYTQDKHFGETSFDVTDSVQAIQLEIMTNGPVAAGFFVYSDFMSYSSGVYQHTSRSQMGGHAIKIIGWGTDNGKPYWTIANSWGKSWGEGGFFRMIRGVNEGRIEEMVTAGTARV